MKRGRPPEYNSERILGELTEWLSEGKTLRAFCRQEGYPSKSEVYNLLRGANAEITGLIAQARDEGFDALADECLEIIDSATDANLGKARVWTRLQLLAKWNPKKYGDKIQNEHTGPNGGPVQFVVKSILEES